MKGVSCGKNNLESSHRNRNKEEGNAGRQSAPKGSNLLTAQPGEPEVSPDLLEGCCVNVKVLGRPTKQLGKLIGEVRKRHVMLLPCFHPSTNRYETTV